MTTTRPTQAFLAFISEGDSTQVRQALAELTEGLVSARCWQCGPPTHFLVGGTGDDADDTIGCELEVFSAVPIGSLPYALDRQAFDDVTFLIGELSRFALSHDVTFECRVENAIVGEIESGVPDRGVRDGFIGEWMRHLSTLGPDVRTR